MPFRLVMLLVLALGAVLVGHVRGGARAATAEPSTVVRMVKPIKARHQLTVRALAHPHNHGELHATALYDDDDDDDDGDDGLAAPPVQTDDDASPIAIAIDADAIVPTESRSAPFERSDLGPASGHPRPHEPPPRS